MSDIFFCLSFGARLPGVESGIVAENGTYFALRVIFTGQKRAHLRDFLNFERRTGFLFQLRRGF